MPSYHNIYRGTTPANIDWSTPVAAVAMPGESATIVGAGHVAGQTYFYGCRPETDTGLITPDLSNIVEFTLDDAGEWPGSRPAAVPVFTATVRPSAEIRTKWRYAVSAGRAVPDKFQVEIATGPSLFTGLSLTDVTYTGQRWYNNDHSGLVDGANYWFRVRAATGDAVSGWRTIGPYRADSTAPATPDVTVEAVW